MTTSQSAIELERSFLIDDAAQLLGVSRRTIYYRIRDGRLRTLRARGGSQRVLLSSIEALLREKRDRKVRRNAQAPDDPPRSAVRLRDAALSPLSWLGVSCHWT